MTRRPVDPAPAPPSPSPGLDPAAVDYVLSTTRAVRRRLDLTRPVDPQVILDCIDVAEQAPSGGNVASRRWMVVTDPHVKAGLAGLYRAAAGDFIIGERDRLAGTGHPMAATMESAAHLVEHLADVPAIVIPTIVGRHDGSGRPGLFDSVIQAAWSFCLALRARGLGTAWTTAVFRDEREVKELLGIPAHTTEIVMLPVAYTVGTDFARVRRRPAREITYFDRWGHTFDRGPGRPASVGDGAGGVVEIDIGVAPKRLWGIVDDVDVLARAAGRSAAECVVDERVTNRSLAWSFGPPDGMDARWRLELEPMAGATRVRLSVTIGANARERDLHPIVDEHRRTMQRTLEDIKAQAETGR